MFLKVALVLLTMSQVAADDLLAPYRAAAIERWEKEVQALEALDAQENFPQHAILFIGSSSVRMWDTMAEDMAPWPTIRRGYGGAKLSDLCVFVERLVRPHPCDALVVFVANDISGAEHDKSPAEVLQLYQQLVTSVRELRRTQPIYFVAITPSSSRFKVWEQIRAANQLIRDYCDADPSLHYIDTADRYLTRDGTPNDDLFQDDKLHLNRAGYKLWGEIIRSELNRTLPHKPGR